MVYHWLINGATSLLLHTWKNLSPFQRNFIGRAVLRARESRHLHWAWEDRRIGVLASLIMSFIQTDIAVDEWSLSFQLAELVEVIQMSVERGVETFPKNFLAWKIARCVCDKSRWTINRPPGFTLYFPFSLICLRMKNAKFSLNLALTSFLWNDFSFLLLPSLSKLEHKVNKWYCS